MFNFTIKNGHGKYNNLDKNYSNYIMNHMSKINDKEQEKWESYCLIMDELLRIGAHLSFEEVKYRVTDGENQNKVMLDVINKHKHSSIILDNFKDTIQEYYDEELYSKYYR